MAPSRSFTISSRCRPPTTNSPMAGRRDRLGAATPQPGLVRWAEACRGSPLGRLDRREASHRCVEHARDLPMSREAVKEARPVGVVECVLRGPHVVIPITASGTPRTWRGEQIDTPSCTARFISAQDHAGGSAALTGHERCCRSDHALSVRPGHDPRQRRAFGARPQRCARTPVGRQGPGAPGPGLHVPDAHASGYSTEASCSTPPVWATTSRRRDGPIPVCATIRPQPSGRGNSPGAEASSCSPPEAARRAIALAAMAATRLPALCLVPTRVLLEQWRQEIATVYPRRGRLLRGGAPRGCAGHGRHVRKCLSTHGPHRSPLRPPDRRRGPSLRMRLPR